MNKNFSDFQTGPVDFTQNDVQVERRNIEHKGGTPRVEVHEGHLPSLLN